MARPGAHRRGRSRRSGPGTGLGELVRRRALPRLGPLSALAAHPTTHPNRSANGDISVGRARCSVTAETACGAVRVRDVSGGTVVVGTAAGELEVGVHEGVAAWLDVHTSFGSVRNTLGAADGPGPSEGTVEVRARTSFGDVVIGRAASEVAR